MSDEVWQSIERKIRGHHAAAQHLPTSCAECAKVLEPVDFGVDIDTNTRVWATHCCGKWTQYEEKLSEQQLP